MNERPLIDAIAELDGLNVRKERTRATQDWRARLRSIKSSYQEYQRLVDLRVCDWMRGDPYIIADWVTIFSPIESDMWGEIRGSGGLPFWPQLPVGRFFVDFGNPTLKIAIECDGKEFHDPVRDMARDDVLAAQGWIVFRATGALCRKVMEHPNDRRERTGESSDYYDHEFRTETLAGLIEEIKETVAYRRKGLRV